MAGGATTQRVRLRRSAPPFRLELTPLIDVIFLLLTFFIYAMVLMERIELVPMELRTIDSGEAISETEPPPAVTLSFDANGQLYLDRTPISLADVVPSLKSSLTERPDTVLYLAISDEIGPSDRVPELLELWDLLRQQKMPVKMVGKPPTEEETNKGATITP